MRRALCVIVIAAALAAPFAGRVDARLKKSQTHVVGSSVTWDVSGSSVVQVEGAITSESPKCVAGRKVEVHTGPSASLQSLYGSGTTDPSGHFAVSGSAPTDAHYTIYVLKETRGRTRCKGTASFGQFTSSPPS
jgi:hypothetical protein